MCIRLFAARLLALEAVVVVRQRAFAFATVWQADFEETVAHHEGGGAGGVVPVGRVFPFGAGPLALFILCPFTFFSPVRQRNTGQMPAQKLPYPGGL